jgi:alpha/beta superfamily hydrolase
VTTPLRLTGADGVELEAEQETAAGAPRAGMVLCHPHPQFGGTMRSIVIGALFGALPAHGVTCLRFNFRGVEGSHGTHGGGDAERHDVRAAVAHLESALPSGVPLVLTGWSFGADVALSVHDDAIGAWLAIAPPFVVARDLDIVGADARPKLLALAEHDEYRDPETIRARTIAWHATDVEVVPGASHFFVGRTDRLVDLALAYVDRLAAPS